MLTLSVFYTRKRGTLDVFVNVYRRQSVLYPQARNPNGAAMGGQQHSATTKAYFENNFEIARAPNYVMII